MVQKTTDPKRRSGEPGAASRQLLQQLESSLQKHWRLGSEYGALLGRIRAGSSP